MKGNLMIRVMTLLILVAIVLTHLSGQTNLLSFNWLWLAIFPAFMGLQATFTGWCPAELIGKLSKTGECCPKGSCANSSKAKKGAPIENSEPCCGERETQASSCCSERGSEQLEIKVLGTGCPTCVNTVKLIENTAEELGVSVMVTKVEDISDIATYGVMSTPGIVIHDQVVHSGSMPNKKRIIEWFQVASRN